VTQYTVRLFARYAELFAASQLDLSLPAPATVADLVSALRALPAGGALPTVPFVAVNFRQATSSDVLRATDEIALLPPMAGG
jgi:molybdopterin converting factor small subunit